MNKVNEQLHSCTVELSTPMGSTFLKELFLRHRSIFLERWEFKEMMSREAVSTKKKAAWSWYQPKAMGYVFRAWRGGKKKPFEKLYPVAKEEYKNKISLEGIARKHRRMYRLIRELVLNLPSTLLNYLRIACKLLRHRNFFSIMRYISATNRDIYPYTAEQVLN